MLCCLYLCSFSGGIEDGSVALTGRAKVCSSLAEAINGRRVWLEEDECVESPPVKD